MNELALSPLQIPRLALAERLLSDERLARLVSRGNTQAFGTLYARHEQALSRYCRAIVRDEQDSQDALQSAMMHALAALQAGERELKVRPWLYRIVHNESVSLLRRRRVAEDVQMDEQLAAPGDVEGAFELRERLALLVCDLRALSERQRAALVMRELSGLSIEEIAGALGTSPGAAKQTLFEARCALHELAEGRAMECDAARRLVSEHDGRVLRGRRLRAHLRACPSCEAFRGSIETRSADLRALAPPLPALAASGLLVRLLGGSAGGGGPAGGALAGGSLAGGSLTVKALAGVALMTAGTVELTTGTREHRHTSGRVAARYATVLAPAATRVLPLETAAAAGRTRPRHATSKGCAAHGAPAASIGPSPRAPGTAPIVGSAPATAAPEPPASASPPSGGSAAPGTGAQSPPADGGGTAAGDSGAAPQVVLTPSPDVPSQTGSQQPSDTGQADPPADPGPPATGGEPSGHGQSGEHGNAGDPPCQSKPHGNPHDAQSD